MLVDFIAGWIGGMMGVCIGHPLDTIKVHIQTQRNSKNPHYQSILSTVKRLLEKEGVRTLFRGISSPIVGLGFMNAAMFGIYGSCQKLMEDPETILAESISGAASAIGTSIITSPVELSKSRAQVAGKQAGKNPIDILLILYRQEGMYKGIFKGLGLTVVREVPSNITYFIVFEQLAHGSKNETPSLLRLFNAGGLAGVASWVVPYPVDVIKSKIQVDGARGEVKFKNWHDCLMKTIKYEGYAGLYSGLLPTVIRAFPVNGVTFVVVTMLLKYFGEDKRSEKHPHPPRVKETRYINVRW